jgi:hypothetical protein
MSALELKLEAAVMGGSGDLIATFSEAIPQLGGEGFLQVLLGPSGVPECDTCKVSFDGPHCPLRLITSQTGRQEGRLPSCWVFVGRTFFRANTRKFSCPALGHPSKQGRLFHPRGVPWTRATKLFNVQDCWFFAVSLLEEVTMLVAQARVAPLTAIRVHLGRSYSFMKIWKVDSGEDDAVPHLDTAVDQVYKAWYAYIWLVDDEPAKHSICRYCGCFPKQGGDACAKVAMNLSHWAAKKQLAWPEGEVERCDECRQLLGSGGFALKFSEHNHQVCFSCLHADWVQQSGMLNNVAFKSAVGDLRKSDTSQTHRATCIATIQGCINTAYLLMSWPGCPLEHQPDKGGSGSFLRRVPPQVTQPAVSGAQSMQPPLVVDGPTLWTQQQLHNHCGRHLLRLCFHGSNPDLPPIPVDKVPPIFQDPAVYAGETLFNTARLKGLGSHFRGGGNVAGPTPSAIAPLLDLIKAESFSVSKLRDISTGNGDTVKRWLRACGMPANQTEKLSAAKGRDWLLKAWDLMVQGKDGCHMFVSALHATGGTADLCCPHGVEICTKILFEEESLRDYLDMLRSQIMWPSSLMIDASCGVVTALEGNYPSEARELWADFRGTFKHFIKDSEIADGQLPDLSCVAIPEHQNSTIRQRVTDPRFREQDVLYASQVKQAKGGMRLCRHPHQTGAHWQRSIVSDRLHQSPFVLLRKGISARKNKPNSHKKPSCCQHLISICPDLNDCRSSVMESLNARKKLWLATICTTDPIHHLVITEKLRRWSNRRIVQQQDADLAKSAMAGEMVVIDPVFGFAHIVCSSCRKGGHVAKSCPASSARDASPQTELDGVMAPAMKAEPGVAIPVVDVWSSFQVVILVYDVKCMNLTSSSHSITPKS